MGDYEEGEATAHMSKRRTRMILFSALTGLGLTFAGLAGPEAAAAPVTVHASAASHFASSPSKAVRPLADSGTITAGKCKYKQSVDDPHVTGGDASVHGYWKKVSGTCPSKANIDVYLQAWWCDWLGCRWVTVASDSGDYKEGGGRGKRATARRTCSSTAKVVGWRGYVDVDLIGVHDPAGYTYSAIKNLHCVP